MHVKAWDEFPQYIFEKGNDACRSEYEMYVAAHPRTTAKAANRRHICQLAKLCYSIDAVSLPRYTRDHYLFAVANQGL